MKSTNHLAGRIFWAVLILGGGVLLTLSALGTALPGKTLEILGSLLLLGIAVSSAVKLRFFFTFLPLAGMAYIWKDFIGFPQMQLWPMLGAGALVGIGLSVLFHRKHEWPDRKHFHIHRGDDDDEECKDVTGESTTETLDADESVKIEASFGEQTKYIHSERLKKVDLSCNFASVKAFFDQCKVDPEGLTIQISGNFGGIELMLPRTWAVENKISSFAAAVNEEGRETSPSDGKVTLVGSLNFAEVKIHRI